MKSQRTQQRHQKVVPSTGSWSRQPNLSRRPLQSSTKGKLKSFKNCSKMAMKRPPLGTSYRAFRTQSVLPMESSKIIFLGHHWLDSMLYNIAYFTNILGSQHLACSCWAAAFTCNVQTSPCLNVQIIFYLHWTLYGIYVFLLINCITTTTAALCSRTAQVQDELLERTCWNGVGNMCWREVSETKGCLFMAHLIVSLHVQYGHYLFAVHCDKNFARSYFKRCCWAAVLTRDIVN